MLTIIEYAILSAHVYGIVEPKKIQRLSRLAIHERPPQTGLAHMTDVDPNMVENNHFFARLYMKFNNHKATDAVVAVRGTLFDDKTNKAVDVLSWVTDVMGEGHHDRAPFVFTGLLLSFVCKARDYIRKYFPHISHLKFTGHSLGGALAQLMPLQAGFLGETDVFNSPGVGNMPGVIEKNQNWITNVNSHYGVINKIGKLLGRVYVIDVPNKEAEAKKLFASMDMKDFEDSEKLYQWADKINQNKIAKALFSVQGDMLNMVGAKYRFTSYITTFNSLDNVQPTAQAITANCQAEAIQHGMWNILKAQISDSICAQKYKGNTLNEIITAQHSIDNMILALHQRQYAAVAYQYI